MSILVNVQSNSKIIKIFIRWTFSVLYHDIHFSKSYLRTLSFLQYLNVKADKKLTYVFLHFNLTEQYSLYEYL